MKVKHFLLPAILAFAFVWSLQAQDKADFVFNNFEFSSNITVIECVGEDSILISEKVQFTLLDSIFVYCNFTEGFLFVAQVSNRESQIVKHVVDNVEVYEQYDIIHIYTTDAFFNGTYFFRVIQIPGEQKHYIPYCVWRSGSCNTWFLEIDYTHLQIPIGGIRE